MMNYNCRVCKSVHKDKIEAALVAGDMFRDIAKNYIDYFDCDLHLLEQSVAVHYKKHIIRNKNNNLTSEQIDFLQRLKEGKVGLEEGSRIVAAMVFEKILKNPDDIRFIDFFRTELLKIKQQETTDRNHWATELMNRMFSGHLPPKNCIKCGNPFIQEEKNVQPLSN